jgi:uncharacterized membrane protein YbhN (UPF0104 family)
MQITATSSPVSETHVREDRTGAPKSRWRRTALRLGVSGLTLTVLLLVLPREELWVALRRVSLATWAGALAIYLSLNLLGVLKWRLTVNLSRAGLGVLQAARCYYGGLFGTTFLPSILGGDVIRAGLAFGRARCRTGLVVGSLLDRILDFAALTTLVVFGALLLPDQLEMVSRKVLLPLGGAAIGGLALVAALWFLVPARRLTFKLRRRLVRLRMAIRPALRRPQYLLASLTLGLLLQGSLVLLNAWLGHACGLNCALAIWFFVWPLAKLSAVLPVTQGGVGVREATLAVLFASFDVPAAQAVAVGLVWQSVVITGGLVSGPLALALGYLPRTAQEVARV